MKLCVLSTVGIILSACAGRRLLEVRPHVGDPNARRVERLVQFTLRADWIQSGFFRFELDAAIDLPVLVGLDSAGSACLLTNAQWAAWEVAGDVVACAVPWRLRRPLS